MSGTQNCSLQEPSEGTGSSSHAFTHQIPSIGIIVGERKDGGSAPSVVAIESGDESSPLRLEFKVLTHALVLEEQPGVAEVTGDGLRVSTDVSDVLQGAATWESSVVFRDVTGHDRKENSSVRDV